MTPVKGRFLRSYATFVGAAAVSAGAVIAVGYFPTVRLAGDDAVGSMLAGCAASWIAGCVGAVPLARTIPFRSPKSGIAVLASTVIRFVVVLLLVVPFVLSGWFDRVVFVLWTAISYMVMLLVDTALAVHWIKRMSENGS